MKILIHVLLTALTLLVVARFIPGIQVENLTVAIIAAMVLALLNAVVRPVLVILTLPITVLTLGLFIFIINTSLFMLAASLITGFSVTSFSAALVGSLIVSLVSTVFGRAK